MCVCVVYGYLGVQSGLESACDWLADEFWFALRGSAGKTRAGNHETHKALLAQKILSGLVPAPLSVLRRPPEFKGHWPSSRQRGFGLLGLRSTGKPAISRMELGLPP